MTFTNSYSPSMGYVLEIIIGIVLLIFIAIIWYFLSKRSEQKDISNKTYELSIVNDSFVENDV
jgi:hypothetical protein